MAAQGLVAFKRLYWGNIHGWGLSSETSQDAVLHLAGQLQSPGAPAQKYLTWGGGQHGGLEGGSQLPLSPLHESTGTKGLSLGGLEPQVPLLPGGGGWSLLEGQGSPEGLQCLPLLCSVKAGVTGLLPRLPVHPAHIPLASHSPVSAEASSVTPGGAYPRGWPLAPHLQGKQPGRKVSGGRAQVGRARWGNPGPAPALPLAAAAPAPGSAAGPAAGWQ